MQHRHARILIFAKAPIPGQVKTRLIPPLSPAEAAALYTELLQRTVGLAADQWLAPLEIHCAPSPDHPLFRRLAADSAGTLHGQQGHDLGARMYQALAATQGRAEYAILIGGDIPSLQAADLAQGLAALEQGADAVLGPAEDGGYYLIGLRRAEQRLFTEIPWGTARVLDTTRRRLQALGWDWRELPRRWDLDRPEDLERYSALRSTSW